MSQSLSIPLRLVVGLPADVAKESVPIAAALQELYRRGEFTDVALQCSGQTFLAHRIVLASQSAVFRRGFLRDNGQSQHAITGREEVRLADISNPEAVKLMLDYLYQIDFAWRKCPRTQDIINDVLRLAHSFQLPGLTAEAEQWLVKDVTTGNVLERLKICEEFGLQELTEGILEQLTFNRRALSEVASSPDITQHPKLLQALLQMTAAVPDVDEAKVLKNASPAAGLKVEDLKNDALSPSPSNLKLKEAQIPEDIDLQANIEFPPDLPETKVLVLTGKVASTPYIAKRAKRLAGLTVGEVLKTKNFCDSNDKWRKYRVQDLRYDLRHGFLSLASGHRKYGA